MIGGVIMKNKVLSIICALICMMTCSACLTGCGMVVPCAWVKLDMDGYIVYTANMYASGGDHIYLYESEEDAADDRYHAAFSIAIVFYPRILGADTVDGERTTTVDVSSWYSMTVYINKNKSVYASSKKVYLNGEVLTPTNTSDLESLLCLNFEGFSFVRGNTDGSFNGYVNSIVYDY